MAGGKMGPALRNRLLGMRYGFALATLGLLCLLATAWLVSHIREREQQAWRREVDLAVFQRQWLVQSRLDTLVSDLRMAAQLLQAQSTVDQQAFNLIGTPVLRQAYGLGWVDRLPAAGHAQDGNCPATDFNYLVRFQVTRSGQSPMVGRNLRCDPARVRGISQAAQTNGLQVTDRIRLHHNNAPGVVLIAPMAARAGQGTQAFLLASVEFDSLIDGIHQGMPHASLYRVMIEDPATASAGMLYPVAGVQGTGWHVTADLHVAGHALKLLVFPTAEQWQARNSRLSFNVLVAGLLFTILLLLFVHSQVISRRRAELLSIVRSDDLVDRENRLAALFMNASIGIMRCDARGGILQVNDAAASMLGCRPERLLGRGLTSLFDPESGKCLQTQPQEFFWSELQLVNASGELVPVMVRVLPLRMPSGQPYAWVLLDDLRDVRHAERLKMQFVSTISHELRTPLTAIKSAIELLGIEPVSDDGQALLRIASQNAEQLHRLIDNLLDMEQVQRGTLSLRPREQDIVPLLHQVAAMMTSLLTEKQQNLALDLPEHLVAWVDGARFVQVIVNLLSNANKFSPPSSNIVVRAEAAGDQQVVVSVQDHGMGISEAFQTRLFQPFVQADASDGRRHGGSGLGLAISSRLIEQMGGTISVRSELGRGACFSVILQAAYGTRGAES